MLEKPSIVKHESEFTQGYRIVKTYSRCVNDSGVFEN